MVARGQRGSYQEDPHTVTDKWTTVMRLPRGHPCPLSSVHPGAGLTHLQDVKYNKHTRRALLLTFQSLDQRLSVFNELLDELVGLVQL